MRFLIKLEVSAALVLSLGQAARGYGQNPSIYEPVSTGFQVPRLAGTLNTSVSASEDIVRGYSGAGTTVYFTNLSGNAGYVSKSVAHPFSMVYGGGYMLSTTNQPSAFFQTLALSQVLTLKRWEFVVADDVSYLPQAPVGGFSGVLGVGDLGVNPPQVGLAGNGLQSGYSPRVMNTISGSAIRMVTGRTSLAFNGSHELIRFPGSNIGIENTQVSAGAALTHHTDARTIFSAGYDFTRLDYPQFGLTFHSQGLLFGVSRQWTQNWSTSVGAGPLFTTSLTGQSAVDYSVNTKVKYDTPRYQASIDFARAVNAGSGVTTASVANHATLFLTRQLGPYANIALSTAYNQQQTLPSQLGLQYKTSNIIGSAQFTRAVTRKLSMYGSYSAQHQTVDQGIFSTYALQGLSQSIAFGLTYTPRPINIGSR